MAHIIFNRQQVVAALRCEAISAGWDADMDVPPADECNVDVTLDNKGRLKHATLTWDS
jgi:hypothetical protein